MSNSPKSQPVVSTAMRAWCRYIVTGGTIYRTGYTSGYRGYKEGVGGKSITYVMGLQLEKAGLIVFRSGADDDAGIREAAELTDAGHEAAAVVRKPAEGWRCYALIQGDNCGNPSELHRRTCRRHRDVEAEAQRLG